MMVRTNLDPDLIGKIIKMISEHSDEIAQVHPAGKDYSVKNAYGSADYAYSLGYKFHPGTVTYLKEQKAWNPKYE